MGFGRVIFVNQKRKVNAFNGTGDTVQNHSDDPRSSDLQK